MTKIIDGKAIGQLVEQQVKIQIAAIEGRPPCLTVVMVGFHPASEIYVNRKMRACSRVGIRAFKKHFPEDITESNLLKEIQSLNESSEVDAILVQLPLPLHIDPHKVTFSIFPEKDVDGFHPINLGKLLMGSEDGMVPCTPLGIQHMLVQAGIALTGKNVVIVGRSNIVGKPLAALLVQNTPKSNATVTLAHRFTKNLFDHTRLADIIVMAIGVPHFLKPNMIREGAIVIDVGINQIEDKSEKGYRIVGDADFESLKEKTSMITPVPGGVGPLTIAMVLKNTLKCYKNFQS